MPELTEGQILAIVLYLGVGVSVGIHVFNESWHFLLKILGLFVLIFLWLPIALCGLLLDIWYGEA